MIRHAHLLVFLALAACDRIPGQPSPESRWKPATAVTSFDVLYRENCSGCHGANGVVAASIAMDNPTYFSVVPREALRTAIAKGVPGTAMPPFSVAEGGNLTDEQLEILVNGILSKKPAGTEGMPPYAAPLGNVADGQAAFAVACASCHGTSGAGGETAGSVIDPDYLALVTDQYLRTIVIAGRPDLGCPDFAGRIPGRAMTSEEVSGVTAWLVSNRKDEFGRPLVPAAPHLP